MPLGILCEQPACILKHDVIAHAGEHVEHLTLFRSRITNAVGRNQWDAQTPGGFERGLIASFFFAVEMPLDLCENITPAKDVNKVLQFGSSIRYGFGTLQAWLLSRRETDQPFCELRHFFRSSGAFTFFCAELHASGEAAQVLITGTVLDQQRI